MTDERLRELSKSYIIEAIESTTFNVQDENRSLTIESLDNGLIEFRVSLSLEPYGSSDTKYYPQIALEEFIKAIDEAFSTYVERYSSQEAAKAAVAGFKYFVEEKIKFAAQMLVALIVNEFTQPFIALPKLSFSLAELFSVENLSRYKKPERQNKLRQIIEQTDTERHRIFAEIEEQVLNLLAAPKYTFCHVYDSELEEWQEIKAFYKRNKMHKDVINLVKRNFPDFDEDLIERLANPDKYIAMPSNIALESTARMLNVPNSIASDRSLNRYLQESRKIREQVSLEEVEEALRKYRDFVNERITYESNLEIARLGRIDDDKIS